MLVVLVLTSILFTPSYRAIRYSSRSQCHFDSCTVRSALQVILDKSRVNRNWLNSFVHFHARLRRIIIGNALLKQFGCSPGACGGLVLDRASCPYSFTKVSLLQLNLSAAISSLTFTLNWTGLSRIPPRRTDSRHVYWSLV